MKLKPTKSSPKGYSLSLIILLISYQTNLALNQIINDKIEVKQQQQQQEQQELSGKNSTQMKTSDASGSLMERGEAERKEKGREKECLDKLCSSFDKENSIDSYGRSENFSMYDSNYSDRWKDIKLNDDNNDDDDNDDKEGAGEDGDEIEVEVGNEFFIYLPTTYGDRVSASAENLSQATHVRVDGHESMGERQPMPTTESVAKSEPEAAAAAAADTLLSSKEELKNVTLANVEEQLKRLREQDLVLTTTKSRESDKQIDGLTLKRYQENTLFRDDNDKNDKDSSEIPRNWPPPALDGSAAKSNNDKNNDIKDNNNGSSNFNKLVDKNSSLLELDPRLSSSLETSAEAATTTTTTTKTATSPPTRKRKTQVDKGSETRWLPLEWSKVEESKGESSLLSLPPKARLNSASSSSSANLHSENANEKIAALQEKNDHWQVSSIGYKQYNESPTARGGLAVGSSGDDDDDGASDTGKGNEEEAGGERSRELHNSWLELEQKYSQQQIPTTTPSHHRQEQQQQQHQQPQQPEQQQQQGKNNDVKLGLRERPYCFGSNNSESVFNWLCQGFQLIKVPVDLDPSPMSLRLLNTGIETLTQKSLTKYKESLRDFSIENAPNLMSIEAGTFAEIIKLRVVYIFQAPKLVSFDMAVSGLHPELTIIRIQQTGLKRWPDLSGFKQDRILTSVDLDNNRIATLGKKPIRIRIELLNLEFNKITSVEESTFNGSEIGILSLNGNRELTFIHPNAFQNLKSLIKLDLSGTSVVELPTTGLHQLRTLIMRDTWTMKRIPSIYVFPMLENAHLTYAYHCCSFRYPETHDPHAYEEHLRLQEEINNLCGGKRNGATISHINAQKSPATSRDHQLNQHQQQQQLKRQPQSQQTKLHTEQQNQVQTQNPRDDFEGFFDGEQNVDSNATSKSLSTSGDITSRGSKNSKQPQLVLNFDNGGTSETSSSSPMKQQQQQQQQSKQERIIDGASNFTLSNNQSLSGDLDNRFQFILHNIECGELALRQVHQSINCTPEPDAFNPCEDIMGHPVLRVAVWFVVACSISGNMSVIVVLMGVFRHLSVPKFLQLNLAIGDLFMGVYLAMLAIADLITVGTYFDFAMDWQHGYGCKIAGAVSLFASQLSIFTLSVITFERYYTITYSIDLNMRLQLTWASRIMFLGWLYAFSAAMLPIFADINSYSKTSICLPMRTTYLLDRVFILVLLIIDSSAFIIIFACYLKMYLLIIKQKTEATAKERTVAMRMALLVATDFACWAPIIFFSTTALLGGPLISVSNSKILIVFFYPLNSMANPFLYVITTRQYRKDLNYLYNRWQTWRSNLFRKDSDSFYNTNNNNINNNYGVALYPGSLNAHLGAVAAVTGVANHLRHNYVVTNTKNSRDNSYDCLNIAGGGGGINSGGQNIKLHEHPNRVVCTKSTHHGQYIIRHQILTDKRCLTIDDRHSNRKQHHHYHNHDHHHHRHLKQNTQTRMLKGNDSSIKHNTCIETICNNNNSNTDNVSNNKQGEANDHHRTNVASSSTAAVAAALQFKDVEQQHSRGGSVKVRVNDETDSLQTKNSDKFDNNREGSLNCPRVVECSAAASSSIKSSKAQLLNKTTTRTSRERQQRNKHRKYNIYADSFAECCNRCCTCCSSSRCSSIQGNPIQLLSNMETKTTEINTINGKESIGVVGEQQQQQQQQVDKISLINLEEVAAQVARTQNHGNQMIIETKVINDEPINHIDHLSSIVTPTNNNNNNNQEQHRLKLATKHATLGGHKQQKKKRNNRDLDPAVDILGNLSYNEPTSSVSGLSTPPTSGGLIYQQESCKIRRHSNENSHNCSQASSNLTNSHLSNDEKSMQRRCHSQNSNHQGQHHHHHHHHHHQHNHQHRHHKHRHHQELKYKCRCKRCHVIEQERSLLLKSQDSELAKQLESPAVPVDVETSSLCAEVDGKRRERSRNHCCHHRHSHRHHNHNHTRHRSHSGKLLIQTVDSSSIIAPDPLSNSSRDLSSSRRTSHESQQTSGPSGELNSNNSGPNQQFDEAENGNSSEGATIEFSVKVDQPGGHQKELESILKPAKQTMAEMSPLASSAPKRKGSHLLSLFRVGSLRQGKENTFKSKSNPLRESQRGKKRVSIIATHHSS